MTPTLKHRLQCEVWSILPNYIELFTESIDRAQGLVGVVKVEANPLVQRSGDIAVVSVSGALGKKLDWFEKGYMGMTDYDDIAEAVEQVSQAEEFEKIVFHFDTPGGSVTGCPELANQIKAIDKPTVAFTDSLMASAGYWLGSQCDAVYAAPSSRVGSVGCYRLHVDHSGLLEKLGLNISMFKKGKDKAAFSPYSPLSKAEKEELQASTDKIHGQFKAAVSSSRTVDATVFDSKCYDADEALGVGVIDGHINSLPQLIQFLA